MEKIKSVLKKNSKLLVTLISILTIVAVMVGIFYWDLNKVDISAYNAKVTAGDEAVKIRDYSAAFNSYSEAKTINPKGFKAYSGLIQVMAVKGLYTNADEIIVKASQNLTSNEVNDLEYIYAVLLFEQGEFEKVLELLKESDDSYERYNELLNESYVKVGDIDAAEEKGSNEFVSLMSEYEEVSKLAGSDLFRTAQFSKSAIEAGFPYLAIDVLEANSEAIEEYWEAQLYLGRAYFEVEDFDKAKKAIETAKSLGGIDPLIPLTLGKIELADGGTEKAIDLYLNAINITESAEAQSIIAQDIWDFVLSEKRYLVAEDILDAHKELTVWSFVASAELAFEQGEIEVASTILTTEVEGLNPQSNPYYWRVISKIAQKNSDITLLESSIDALMKIDESDPFIYIYKAWIAELSDNSVEAKSNYNKAIDIDLNGDATVIAKRALGKK